MVCKHRFQVRNRECEKSELSALVPISSSSSEWEEWGLALVSLHRSGLLYITDRAYGQYFVQRPQNSKIKGNTLIIYL